MNHHKCGECGKAFRSEAYLDLHLDRFHPVNGSGKGCLADYCTILDCPSLPDTAAGRSDVLTESAAPLLSDQSQKKPRLDDRRESVFEGVRGDHNPGDHDMRRQLFVCEALINRCLLSSKDSDLIGAAGASLPQGETPPPASEDTPSKASEALSGLLSLPA